MFSPWWGLVVALKGIGAAALILALAGVSSAQAQTTAPTAFTPPMVDQARGAAVTEALQRQNASQAQAATPNGHGLSDMLAAGQREITRAKVADAIRANHCAEAKDIALEAHDLDLAEQSQRLCSP